MSRPRKEIDWEEFEKLCFLQCTQQEIMGFFDIKTKDTLNTRIREQYGDEHCFSTIYEQKSQGGKISIRRKQFQVGMSGNVSMLIWLGKNWLGQSDKQEHIVESEIKIVADSDDLGL